MVATNQNIEIYAGDDVAIDMQIFDVDGTTPLDLSGVTVNWALSSVYDLRRQLVFKTSTLAGQVAITDALQGLVTIVLDPTDTATLGGQPYYHEAEVIDLSLSTVTVMTGGATIKKTLIVPTGPSSGTFVGRRTIMLRGHRI